MGVCVWVNANQKVLEFFNLPLIKVIGKKKHSIDKAKLLCSL